MNRALVALMVILCCLVMAVAVEAKADYTSPMRHCAEAAEEGTAAFAWRVRSRVP